MRHPNLLLLSLLVLLTGCSNISPFVGADLKIAICDRDSDGLLRTSDYCGGNDCDDGDRNVGEPMGWFRDVDIDSFGAGEAQSACIQPDGYVDLGGDCDDTDELVNPDATETCNGYDDNCDGGVDNENIPTWFADLDEDGWGDPAVPLQQCDEPEGYVLNALDCDDGNSLVNPDGTEVCDDWIDQDCNDLIDDAAGAQLWYADMDSDGWGDPAVSLYSCEASVDGYVLDGNDCDDTSYDVSPASSEACGDGIDNDCDGEIDTDAQDVPWYRDADEDGWGDSDDTTTDCAPPEGYVGNAQDCNDASSEINPLAEEVCNNGIDDNCDVSANDCEITGTVNLADADAVFTGLEEADYAGFNVSSAGDVNADGEVDILIGAYNAGEGGEAYVFFGPHSGALDTGMADVTLVGPTNTQAGYAVAGGCDLDGDGSQDDLVIGAKEDTDGGSAAGAVWVTFGPLTSGTYELDAIGTKLTGSASSWSGSSLSCSGDVNADGADDLVVGAPIYNSGAGAAFVVYGPPETGSLSDHILLEGEETSDLAGLNIAITQDVNNDGMDDILVGAYGDDTAADGAGAVYVVYGPGASKNLSEADAKLLGVDASDIAGYSLAPAGDANDDGYGDFLVASFEADDAAGGAGAVYMILGPPTSGSLGDEVTWLGVNTGDNLGYAMAGGCDINGDGWEDAVLAARYAGDSDTGIVYGLYSPTTGGSANSANFQLVGESSNDAAGGSISLFDANADGLCDILVGVPLANAGAPDAGKTYLIFGLGY